METPSSNLHSFAVTQKVFKSPIGQDKEGHSKHTCETNATKGTPDFDPSSYITPMGNHSPCVIFIPEDNKIVFVGPMSE